MKDKCLLLSTFSTFQTPLTLLTNCAMVAFDFVSESGVSGASEAKGLVA